MKPYFLGKNTKVLLCIFLEEPGFCPKATLLFLDASSFASAFLPFLEKQMFESALWNSGRSRRLNEAYFLQTRNGGHRKDLYPGGPHRVYVFVQSLSRVWLFVTPWATSHQASLSFTLFHSLLKLMSIESVMPSNHLISSTPFCSQSFPGSVSFPVSQLFASGG